MVGLLSSDSGNLSDTPTWAPLVTTSLSCLYAQAPSFTSAWLGLPSSWGVSWLLCIRTVTFSLVSLHQAVPGELHALAPEGGGMAAGLGIQLLPIYVLCAGQVGAVESQGSKQQPGVVVDVGLDEPLPVADPNGHHWVGCDAVGRQVAAKVRRF